MIPDPIYHELTKAVNIPGYFVTGCEANENRIRFYLERRNHVARCSGCGQFCGRFYDSKERVLRDFDCFNIPSYLIVQRVRVQCPRCGVRVEKLPFAQVRGALTTRFQEFLVMNAQMMTRSDVARLYGLSEDTIGRLEWQALQEFQPTRSSLKNLRLLRIDELAKRKGHNYVSIIVNAETGRVVWVADGRRKEDLRPFFEALGARRRLKVEAVCMDMSRSYIPAFEQWCPRARLVFDRFHIVKHFNEALNDLRKSEILKSPDSEKKKWRHSKRALGKNKCNLNDLQRECLLWMLREKPVIARAYQLKPRFSNIWEVATLRGAKIALTRWIQRANKIEHESMRKFCRMLERHRKGILNYHLYPLTNGPQEGFNNKLNVLRRRAYGFRNVEWFSLKIIQASAPGKPAHA
ncbi:MAG: ISL3 family transposase [Planctomycetaceae bacterium]|nr:ISL3 family transposase [Planctomycetaceae bacterium]